MVFLRKHLPHCATLQCSHIGHHEIMRTGFYLAVIMTLTALDCRGRRLVNRFSRIVLLKHSNSCQVMSSHDGLLSKPSLSSPYKFCDCPILLQKQIENIVGNCIGLRLITCRRTKHYLHLFIRPSLSNCKINHFKNRTHNNKR